MQISTKDNSRLFYYFIANLQPQPMNRSAYISNGVTVFQHCLWFVTIELVDLRMYGIIERKQPPRPNAASCKASESDSCLLKN